MVYGRYQHPQRPHLLLGIADKPLKGEVQHHARRRLPAHLPLQNALVQVHSPLKIKQRALVQPEWLAINRQGKVQPVGQVGQLGEGYGHVVENTVGQG